MKEIGGKPFKITLSRHSWGNIGMSLEVLSDPEPCTIKSRWKLVNWWRKLTGTEEHGYTYKVKQSN